MEGDKKKIIIVVVLLILAPVAYLWANRESEFDRQYRENLEASQQEQAAQQAAAPPGRAGAPAAAAAPAAASGSRFQEADIDVDALVQEVREVDFNYDLVRQPRNPMTPLVGGGRFAQIGGGPGGGGGISPALEARHAAQMKQVTGIIWDETNPLAVVISGNEQAVVSEGFEFPLGIVVQAIEPNRVILRVDNSLIPITLKE